MYNPRSYARIIERTLGTPEYLTGEIEKDPLAFLASFHDKIYETNGAKANLIDQFDDKYAKYKNTPLCSWAEEDTQQMTNDLKEIDSK